MDFFVEKKVNKIDLIDNFVQMKKLFPAGEC